MRRLVLYLACGALAFLLVAPASAGASGRDRADDTQTFRQAVPVNLVFIGYPRQMVDVAGLLGTLPSTYTPLVRYPQFYGIPARDVGLQFGFNYKVRFAGAALENRFFGYWPASASRANRPRSSWHTTIRRTTSWTSRRRCSTSTVPPWRTG